MKCEHDREKSRCRECNGPGEGSFCLHGIVRGTCSSCQPEKAFLRCQRQAQERGIPFMLTEVQYREIVSKPCHYCGTYGVPRGVDRVINTQPYAAGNVACCPRCNRWKSNESEDLFLGHVRRIQQHQEKLRLKSEIDRGGIAGVAPAHSPVECINDNL